MMRLHKGYWISGSAVPGPPYATYWEILGTILESQSGGSVVEVARQYAETHDENVKHQLEQRSFRLGEKSKAKDEARLTRNSFLRDNPPRNAKNPV